MDFNVKIEGLESLKQASQAVRDAVAKEIVIAIDASGRQVISEAKKSILSGSKTGRTYHHGKVVHRASAPGEAPASDTGRLVNSIASQTKVNDGGDGIVSATVQAGKGAVKYAAMLEFGTSKMAPRPYFLTALEKSKRWIQDRINQAVTKGLNKGGK